MSIAEPESIDRGSAVHGGAAAAPTRAAETDRALADLLAQVARRCPFAFRQLHDMTQARMFGVVLKVVGERAVAEEVLQEAYVKVWHQAAQFSVGKGRVLPWLAAICRNGAIDQVRHSAARPKARLAFDDDDDAADPYGGLASSWPEPLEVLTRSRGAQAIRQCLLALGDGPRESLTLSFYDGLSHGQIAAQMGQPLGTVKSWVRRALVDLRPALAGHR